MYRVIIHFLVILSFSVIHYHIENLFLNLQHIVINMSFLVIMNIRIIFVKAGIHLINFVCMVWWIIVHMPLKCQLHRHFVHLGKACFLEADIKAYQINVILITGGLNSFSECKFMRMNLDRWWFIYQWIREK